MPARCCAGYHCFRKPTERCVWCVFAARRRRRQAAGIHAEAAAVLSRVLPATVVRHIVGALDLPPLPVPFACRPCLARAFVACHDCVPPFWADGASDGESDGESDGASDLSLDL